VAETKVEALLHAGALVTVIAPAVTDRVGGLAQAGRVVHHSREYRSGDLSGFRLVIVATDDPAINRRAAAEAEKEGALVNVVDAPELCTFIAPAVLERGDLQIAVSTSGAAPAFAARLRDRLASELGPEYAVALVILRKVRARLHAESRPAAERRRILRDLAESDLAALAKARDRERIDRLLADCLGDGMSLERLGVALP